jgi:flagellar operon protein
MNNDYILRRLRVNSGDSQVQQDNTSVQSAQGQSFSDVMKRIQDSDVLKFSKHAMQRLDSRNIQLSESDVSRISDGVDKAKQKGVKEALIMMDNKVFVASVKNNTIITAAVDDQLKDNVFTNIDGAVIV